MKKTHGEVTELLRAWSEGDGAALNRLLPLVLDEARMIARKALASEAKDITLEPTELINEVYMRLVVRKSYWWKDRVQFFSSLAELMRRILVDRARKRKAAKRGSGVPALSLDETVFHVDDPHPDLVLLDDVLEDLKSVDRKRYDIVMLWFFVGLTQAEIARELNISVNTVARQWQVARTWLRLEMDRASGKDPATEDPENEELPDNEEA